jgi:hypothetical protein
LLLNHHDTLFLEVNVVDYKNMFAAAG